jgi:hypothetical protein
MFTREKGREREREGARAPRREAGDYISYMSVHLYKQHKKLHLL